jgi:inhibitor of cysteine peptidase
MFIGEEFDGRTVDLPVGQTVEIRLAETPTAGFRWDLTQPGAPTCALLSDSVAPPQGAVGGQGAHSWIFEARRQGECEIALVYHRPWEAGTPPARRFHVRLRIGAEPPAR